MERRVALLGVLAAHLAVAVVHGVAHEAIPVGLAPWQTAVVLATTFLGPVAGVALTLRDHPLGLPVFTAAMAGALAFGVTFHLLVANPDHVHAVPADPWRVPFRATAVGLVGTDAAGTAVGAWYWRRG